jgi:hypothetical protein
MLYRADFDHSPSCGTLEANESSQPQGTPEKTWRTSRWLPNVEQLGATMADILTRLCADLPASGPTRTMQVVAESAMDRPTITTGLHSAFMHAPPIVQGQVTGLVGAFSSTTDAFDTRHVRFLFDMGQKAAEAPSRVRVDNERLEG